MARLEPDTRLLSRRAKGCSIMMGMSPFLACVIVLIALAVIGLPISLSMIGATIFYLLVAPGLDAGTAAEQILNGLFNSYVLLAVPLFILAADLMNTGSLTDRLSNIIFAGMSGSAIADAVGIGKIIIGMMTREGKYPVAYAAAITASAAIIGPIIPPSIPMVIYALVSDASIGFLFLGGVIPGLLLGLAFMAMNALISRRRNYPVEPPVSPREIPRAAWDAFPALLLPVILLVGIYGGVMTPTEGAAAAAAYALLAAALIYRALSMRQLYGVLLSSGKATASVGMLIAGALAFNYVVTAENIPIAVQHFVEGFHPSKIGFLLLVNAILLVLGCLLEGTTILLIIVPIFIPTVKALGIDTVHFGVVAVVNIMIGLLTPPFGLLLFIVASMTKQPLLSIVREAAPFILAAIGMLAVITFVPETVLWLPRMMGYKG
jgi:C4-dicarboxylate transporter DctM subunit